MQVAGGRALGSEPLRFLGERADLAALDGSQGATEQGEGGAQAAQRHTGLVDAGWPPAFQHDRPVLQEFGMAFRRDLPQRRIGRGIRSERAGHGGETV
jgi:hypothetical protein